jgi:hypothetical protein
MSDAAGEEEGGFGRLRHPVLLVLLYTLAGPPLGAALLFALLSLLGAALGQPAEISLLPPTLLFSYFYGAVPAFACGLLVLGWSSQAGTPVPAAVAGAMGGVTASVLPFLQQVVSGPPDESAPGLSFFALCGLAGIGAALLIRRLGDPLHRTPV